MEPLLDKIARHTRVIENTPPYKKVTRYVTVVLLWLLVPLFIGVGIYAYVNAKQKHADDELPSGRGMAVCVELGFSALFCYFVVDGLISGSTSVGGKTGGGINIRRSTGPFVFYLAIAGWTAASLGLFYLGVGDMFAG